MLETMGLRLTTRWRVSRNGQCYLKGWGLIQLSLHDLRIDAGRGRGKINRIRSRVARWTTRFSRLFQFLVAIVSFISILEEKFLNSCTRCDSIDAKRSKRNFREFSDLQYNHYDFQHFFVDFIITRTRYYHRYTRFRSINSIYSPFLFPLFINSQNLFKRCNEISYAYCSYEIDNNTHRFVSI